jgi:hypothetical protein
MELKGGVSAPSTNGFGDPSHRADVIVRVVAAEDRAFVLAFFKQFANPFGQRQIESMFADALGVDGTTVAAS